MAKLIVSLVVVPLSLACSALVLADKPLTKTFTNRDVRGSYAFSFQGEILS